MKYEALFATVLLAAASAAAQNSADTQIFETPYWTEKPVIEALGRAKLELPPNRGQFAVRFVETNKNAESAMQEAVKRARAAYAAIKAVSGDASEVTTSVRVDPYFEQYRDRDGDRIENRRADKVVGYEARVSVQILMKDVDLAGEARAAALALGPEESDPLRLFLHRDAESLRQAYAAAVSDGAQRAKMSATATGTTLGQLLVIQEGRGPCMGTWIGATGHTPARRARVASPERAMEKVTVTSSLNDFVDTVSREEIDALNLPSDSPAQTIEAQVCMVYAVSE